VNAIGAANMTTVLPRECLLCGSSDKIKSAGFEQKYRQFNSNPVFISWWECGSCNCWFAFPHPTVEQVAKNWKMVVYQQKSKHDSISVAKNAVHIRILKGIDKKRGGKKGYLLDVGCNFGDFLNLAEEKSWVSCGFDANELAVSECANMGFDVRLAWDVREAGFSSNKFSAIIVNDVFCYTRHPFGELKGYAQLLESGGVLAMRLTNKHLVLRVMRAVTVSGNLRNTRLSNILLDQFHSISTSALRDVLGNIGFIDITVATNASTAPWKGSTWKTRLSYVLSHIAYYLSFGRVNLYPGILVFATKA